MVNGCDTCPDMRPGSSFDGKHLFCERFQVWTNLLDERWRGTCLADDRKGQLSMELREDED